MPGRTIAIGDVHGCSIALTGLLAAIDLTRDDTIITLGDHIDRGPDTRGVIERLLKLSGRCRLIPLMGNHEERLLDALRDISTLPKWLSAGGTDTLKSYGWTPGGPRRALADWIPDSHRKLIATCRPYHETASHIFVHAGLVPDLPLAEQPGLALRWRVTDAATTLPHQSGKIVVVGHTPQSSGTVLDLGHLLCLDTGAPRGGWLTAYDTATGQIWQANQAGRLR